MNPEDKKRIEELIEEISVILYKNAVTKNTEQLRTKGLK